MAKSGKKRWLRVAVFLILGVALALGCLIWQRHVLIAHLYRHSPSLLDKVDEGLDVVWFDDYYTVQELGKGVYAIGEPRYWQRNYNYLVVGDNAALLIDAGPGMRDIRPVVRSLTGLPYTLVMTHMHFDHVGNGIRFPRVSMIDLPHLREREDDGVIQLTLLEHLGKAEGYETPRVSVDEWLPPGATIDLGNRKVRVVYTPGHTVESISLFDSQSNILFTGDWFTPVLGPMFSNSSMGDFLMAVENVLRFVPEDTRVFGAHKYADGGGAPMQSIKEIHAVRDGLKRIRSGELKAEGFYPAVYQVTAKIKLYSDIPWLQRWAPSYPQFKESDER
jgi:glyoxylase-like metal-dependent hydrolase (beta-lactamase superfamily II)